MTPSLMVVPTGSMSGLNGRLNDVSDRQNRGYPCTDKFAVNGDRVQPVPFDVGDARGAEFELYVEAISRRTRSLNFRGLVQELGWRCHGITRSQHAHPAGSPVPVS